MNTTESKFISSKVDEKLHQRGIRKFVSVNFGNAHMILDYEMSNMTFDPQHYKQKARQIGMARVNQIYKKK